MAEPPSDPQRYRRQQRRRAVIGWLGGLVLIAVIVLAAVFGDDHQRRHFDAPYGETMSSTQYGEIEEGEEEADVLERLNASGRPESRTEDYVLILFPPRAEGVTCGYWEFTDEPQIFARLCFDRSSGELVEKAAHDVHEGFEAGETEDEVISA